MELGIKCWVAETERGPRSFIGNDPAMIHSVYGDVKLTEGKFLTIDELVELLFDFHNYVTNENHKLAGPHLIFDMYLKNRGCDV